MTTPNPCPSIHSMGIGQSDFNEVKLEPGLEDMQNPPGFPTPPGQLFSKPFTGSARYVPFTSEREPIRKFTFESPLEPLISQLSSKRYLTRQKALDFLQDIISNHFNQILIHPHDADPSHESESPIPIAQNTMEAASSQFQQTPIHFNANTGIPLPKGLRQQLFSNVKQKLGERTTLEPIGGDLQRLSGIPTGIIHPTEAPSLIVAKLKPLPLSEERRNWLWKWTNLLKGMFIANEESEDTGSIKDTVSNTQLPISSKTQDENHTKVDWEVLQSAFLAIALTLKIQYPLPNFFKFALAQCKIHLDHREARVRFAIGQTLHVLAFMEMFHLSPHSSVPATMIHVNNSSNESKVSTEIFHDTVQPTLDKASQSRLALGGPLFFVYDYIIESVIANIDANFAQHSQVAFEDSLKQKVPDRLIEAKSQIIQEVVNDAALDAGLINPYAETIKAAHIEYQKNKQTELKHDTEGWRSLESSFKIIQQLMSAYGVAFSPLLLNHMSSNNPASPHAIFPRLVKAVCHINRYVREVGYLLLGTLCQVAALDPGVYGSWKSLQQDTGSTNDPRPSMFPDFDLELWNKQNYGIRMPHHSVFSILFPSIVPLLASGLADNWSQVRFASSIATRHLFDSMFGYLARFYSTFKERYEQRLSTQLSTSVDSVIDLRYSDDPAHQIKLNKTYNEENEDSLAKSKSNNLSSAKIPFPFEIAQPFNLDDAYSQLLPAMCLNRYYLAAGVRNFSQETWRRVTQSYGKDLIGYYIGNVVEFYVSQSRADNHAVRQAACSVLAELGSKLASKISNPQHIHDILNALVDCFKDSSWPVREAACTALSSFVTFYPQESSQLVEEVVLPLWLEHLSDNIWSVRESAAIALGRVLRTFVNMRPRVIEHLISNITAVYSQPVDSTLFANLENTTLFGVAAAKAHATHVHHNDEEMHSNQSMYSCGSLAPKIKRGGGCMDHGFTRPKQQWEITDGCIYLLRELVVSLYSDPKASVILFLQGLAPLVEISKFEKSDGTKTHFYHDHVLLLTIYKQIPVIIARFLGIDENILDHRNYMESQPTLSGLPRNPGDILPISGSASNSEYNVHEWGFGVPVKPLPVSQTAPFRQDPSDSPSFDPIFTLLPSIFQGIVSNIHSIMSRKLVACAVIELCHNLADIFGPEHIVSILTLSISAKYPVPMSETGSESEGIIKPQPLFATQNGKEDIVLNWTSVLNFFSKSPYLYHRHKFAKLLVDKTPKVSNSEWRKFERHLHNMIYSRGVSSNNKGTLPELNIDPAVFNRIV